MNPPRRFLCFAVVAWITTIVVTAESQVPAVRYRVAVTPSYAADVGEIARTLAATVRGRVEPYAEQGFDGFVLIASSSAAEILAQDPRVANVTVLASESVATPPPAPTRPSAVATERRPAHVAASASEFLLGPYAYDGLGNITEIGTGQDQFRYDAFGRLKTATVSGVTQDFSYDVYGNIQSVTTNGSTATIGVDSATNRLKSTGAYNIIGQYDSAGRMTGYLGRDTFSYDALDMVKEAVVQSQRKVYLYTASDERLASITISGSAEAASSWTLRDVAGRVIRTYAKTMSNGERWWWKDDYIYREGNLLAAEVDSSAKTLHFHPDHLGTSRLMTGNGGAAIARHDYQPFGGEITAPNQDSERMKFTGHERDYAGALMSDPLDYMHARYYSPGMGRFLSVDPMISEWTPFLPQGWNRYAYTLNNPIRYIDPSGREIECVTMKNDDGTTKQICSEIIEVHAAEPKVAPQPPPPTVFAGFLPLATQQLRMRERDERERLQEEREAQRVANCFENNRFSSLFGDGVAGDVVGFLEVGSEISLAGDVVATAYKATQVSLGNQPYASGMNYGFRSLGRAVNNPALGRSLTRFGDKATPALAVFGAFTGAYNATIYLQCRGGLL